ncbi:chemotaxis MotA protein [Tepidicaulis marinus]|uniref:Chemotaxis MotA protein n=1 Tax=Tepidicaulis marinus TaxID=1333998 RepID=A0A081BB23_9HYPH|nr:flagellar motor stator protein MotA [Tepidicaulis marinus]GAK45241.1 chemotaxis MotA protein [Tepidicaulis marinus]
MGPLIGIPLLIIAVIGGYMGMGGEISVLWQPFEMLIVVGAAISTLIIGNPLAVVKDTVRSVGDLFNGKKVKEEDYLELLSLLYAILRSVKGQGMLQLENMIERPHESELFQQYPRVLANPRAVNFLCDYLRLLSLGTAKPHEIESLMDEEIRILSKDLHRPTHALQVIADALPALGIVAAVLGVIRAMGAINQPPEVLGHLIGGALFGTFIGVFLSYGVVSPLAGLVRTNKDAQISYFLAIKSTLLAHLNGAAAQVAIEYGRKVLHIDAQPSFDAVEKSTVLENDVIRHAKARDAA